MGTVWEFRTKEEGAFVHVLVTVIWTTVFRVLRTEEKEQKAAAQGNSRSGIDRGRGNIGIGSVGSGSAD